MKPQLSKLSVAVVFGLASLCCQQAAAEAFGEYGKATALELAQNYPGRYTGTAQEKAAADFVTQRMRIAGSQYQPTSQAFSFVAGRGVLRGQTVDSRNIIVEQAGVGNTGRTLFVGAHYDSSPSTATFDRSQLQGLDDNASGVGVLTELVRNLSQITTEHDVTFIGFGGEEYGTKGSEHFVSTLSDAEKQNALGMINLDSLITGDFMYANAGDRAYDIANQQVVPTYASLREHAHAIADELGIDLQMNQGDLIAEGADAPYKPYGVGCCSDHEAFDAAGIPVVAFEATNWRLGPEYDGYIQTSNPNISGGATWHEPAEDNKTVLTNVFGENRINQRMQNFAQIITRLIVEETNADVLQSMQSALTQQANLSQYLHGLSTNQQSAVFERANYLASETLPDKRQPGTTRAWFDGHQGYQDTATTDKGRQVQLGLYAAHTLTPAWEIGAGIEANHYQADNHNAVKTDTGYGAKLYSVYTAPQSPWWNTSTLGYSEHDLATSRQVTLGGHNGVPVILDKNEQGDANAKVLSASTELGYQFVNQPQHKHGVYAATHYSDISIDAHQSGQANSRTALVIDDSKAKAWDAEVGYQLQHQFTLADKPVKLKAQLGYVKVIDAPVVSDISATSFADNKVRSAHYQADDQPHYGRLALGVSSNLAAGTWAYVNGETDFAHSDDRDNGYAINVGVQHQF